jgi:predicted phosphoribosyltransferase
VSTAARMNGTFRDRIEAGRLLARELMRFAGRDDVIVLALPRGGVPVAYEVAAAIGAPLDVFIVRKLGAPGHHELAMGAIATGGVRVLNDRVVESLGISDAMIDAVAAGELQELQRREAAYRGHCAPLDVRGRMIILVDDGVATGATMHAAIEALSRMHPAGIVVAVPTAAAASCEELRPHVDELVTLMAPEQFVAVGQWYERFPQTTDDEVTRLIEQARRAQRGHPLGNDA